MEYLKKKKKRKKKRKKDILPYFTIENWLIDFVFISFFDINISLILFENETKAYMFH